jgi:hypothetical protein
VIALVTKLQLGNGLALQAPACGDRRQAGVLNVPQYRLLR